MIGLIAVVHGISSFDKGSQNMYLGRHCQLFFKIIGLNLNPKLKKYEVITWYLNMFVRLVYRDCLFVTLSYVGTYV